MMPAGPTNMFISVPAIDYAGGKFRCWDATARIHKASRRIRCVSKIINVLDQVWRPDAVPVVHIYHSTSRSISQDVV